MTDRKHKRPNAEKHAIFSATAIVPGEDPSEFAALHSALIEEWMPDGASEDDAVLTIAKCVWRKRRVQRFIEVQLLKNLCDPGHPSFDEELGLSTFAAIMSGNPDAAFFEEHAWRCLRPDKIDYLKQKFPRSKYETTEKWAQAIVDEINSVMLPPSEAPDPLAATAALYSSAATLAWDAFKQELALDERLDAMIDQAVKRLIQIKAMKQMLTQTGVETTRACDQQRLSRDTRPIDQGTNPSLRQSSTPAHAAITVDPRSFPLT